MADRSTKQNGGGGLGTFGRKTVPGRNETGYVYNTDTALLAADDGLTAEFRHRIGLLPVSGLCMTSSFDTPIYFADVSEFL